MPQLHTPPLSPTHLHLPARVALRQGRQHQRHRHAAGPHLPTRGYVCVHALAHAGEQCLKGAGQVDVASLVNIVSGQAERGTQPVRLSATASHAAVPTLRNPATTSAPGRGVASRGHAVESKVQPAGGRSGCSCSCFGEGGGRCSWPTLPCQVRLVFLHLHPEGPKAVLCWGRARVAGAAPQLVQQHCGGPHARVPVPPVMRSRSPTAGHVLRMGQHGLLLLSCLLHASPNYAAHCDCRTLRRGAAIVLQLSTMRCITVRQIV